MNHQSKVALWIVGGTVAVVAYFAFVQPHVQQLLIKTEPFIETHAEKLAAMSAAFGDPPGDDARPPADVPAEIAAFFQSMQVAVNSSDPDAYHDHFNFSDMLDIVERHAPGLSKQGYNMRELRAAIEKPLKSAVTTDMFNVQWNRHEIRKVDLFNDGKQAVVYALHPSGDGFPVHFRWFLFKRTDKWLAYDYEQLDSSYNVTLDLAISNDAHYAARSPAWLAHLDTLIAGSTQVGDGKYAEGEATLKGFLDIKMPSQYEAIRWFDLAYAQLNQGKYEEAITSLDKLAAVLPDMPDEQVLRTWAYVYTEEYDKVIVAADKYAAMLGPHADVLYRKGIALPQLEKPDEALAAHAACLKLHPRHEWNLYEFIVTHANRKTPEATVVEMIRPSIRDFENSDDVFNNQARWFTENYEIEALRLLLAAWPMEKPKTTEALFAVGSLAYFDRNYEEAARVLQPLLPKAFDADQRAAFTNRYLASMAMINKPIEAYNAVPERRLAFEYLADSLLEGGHGKLLDELIALHRKHDANDGYIHMIQGQRLLRGENPDPVKADAEFELASKRLDKDREDLHSQLRGHRITAMVDLGAFLVALQKFRPQDETFLVIASQLFNADRTDELTQLIDAHGRTHAKDPWLHYYKGLVAMGSEKYAEAESAFAAGLKLADEDDLRTFQYNRLRALYHLGNAMQAYVTCSGFLIHLM